MNTGVHAGKRKKHAGKRKKHTAGGLEATGVNYSLHSPKQQHSSN